MHTRVLVVDDSLICREMLTDMLQRDREIQVIGAATNGKEAIELNRRLRPDLITMDVHMPGMDGFTAIQEIMATRPVPILVVTSSPMHGGFDLSFRALSVGALDLLRKPELEGAGAELLREKVKLLAGVKVVRRQPARPPLPEVPRPLPQESGRTLVAIAASTGGPRVLLEILGALPHNHSCCFLLTQHLPEAFCQGFAEWLGQEISLRVALARDGDVLEPGRLLVAPSGYHLGLHSAQQAALFADPPCDNHRPSASFMFRSVAKTAARSAVGIVLSGMGSDGARGLRELRQAGGLCIAQDKSSCAVFGMPQAAIEQGAADRVLDPEGIQNLLLRLNRTDK